MKPAVKVFATLALSAAVGERIKKHGHTIDVRGAGLALERAVFEAIRKYPAAGIEKNIDKIADTVTSLLSGPLDPQELLSILVAGLSDIYAKCNPARHEIIDSVIYAAQACLDFYPNDIDHESAFKRYERWCA